MSESLEQGGRADAARGEAIFAALMLFGFLLWAVFVMAYQIQVLHQRCDNLENQVRILKGQR